MAEESSNSGAVCYIDYDKVYHNSLIFTLENGKKYKMEKNAVVEYFPVSGPDKGAKVIDVPLNGKELTLKEMVDNAAKDNADMWKYRADSNNCQQFTRDIIERNGLLPPDEKQDSKALVGTLIGKEKVPNAVTDTYATMDRLWHGDGVKRKIPCPL